MKLCTNYTNASEQYPLLLEHHDVQLLICLLPYLIIDMSTTFDAIIDKTLSSRLSQLYGIRDSAVSCFESFFKDSYQTVLINNFVFDSFILTLGVPSGLVLAQYLVSLYLKRLADAITSFGFSNHFYAGYVQFYISAGKDNNY